MKRLAPRWVAILLCLTLSVTASAEESPGSIYSASFAKRDWEQTASSVTRITEEDIKRSQHHHVLDLLRSVPGVDVVQSGSLGGNASIFLRGANSEHTLVLIDGVEANNPGSNARFFNFVDLTTDNIERVEIIRGPQSAVYGSDAIGGVISITTKKGSGDPKANLSFEGGSYETFTEKASLHSGIGNSGNVSVSMSRQDSDSISALDLPDAERDAYDLTNFSARMGFEPSDSFEQNFMYRHSESNADLDSQGSLSQDDPNRFLNNREIFFRSESKLKWFDGRWIQSFGVGIADHRFFDRNDIDHLSMDTLDSRYDGRLNKFDFVNEIALSSAFRLIAGAETEQERASSDYFSESSFGSFEAVFPEEKARYNGYFMELLYEGSQYFSMSAGLRVDDGETLSEELSYRIAPVVSLPESGTKIFSTVGTGIKAPSLYQRFSSYGTPDLQPEESLGVDAGVEQSFFGGQLTASATYFWNEIDNLVDFDPQTFLFENIQEAKTDGFEFSLVTELCDQLSLNANLTFLDAENRTSGETLLRRAKQKASLQANYAFLGNDAELSLRLRFVGDRYDNDFSGPGAERVKLSSFAVTDILGRYKLNDDISFFGRVENLFDRDYEEIRGFGTRGVSAYGGFELSLG